MAHEVYAAHGIQIKVSNMASSPTFSEIKGVRDIDGPGYEPQNITTRHHGSSAEFNKVTIVKVTPVSFELLYDPAETNHSQLIEAAKNKTRLNFQMVLVDAGAETYAFGSYVQAKLSGPVEGFLAYNITLPIDGEMTRTP